MSSFWDSMGQKLYDGTLTAKEMSELVSFLIDFDRVHGDIVLKMMRPWLRVMARYNLVDWTDFEISMHNGALNKKTLEELISQLHSFDHANNQILMNSFYRDKKYWKKHKIYKSLLGTYKNGVWEPSEIVKGFRDK